MNILKFALLLALLLPLFADGMPPRTLPHDHTSQGRGMDRDFHTRVVEVQQSRTSTTTFSDDTYLSGVPIAADTWYTIEARLHFSSVSSFSDVQVELDVNAVADQDNPGWCWSQIDKASAVEQECTSDFETSMAAELVANQETSFWLHSAFHSHATTATTLDVRWTQGLNNASPTLLLTGSTLTVRRIVN